MLRIDSSQRLSQRNKRFLRLDKPISTSIDAKAFYGWPRDQPSSKEDNVSHQFPDLLLSMFSDDLNDVTDKTNEVDGDHKNVEEEQTTTPMVPKKKKKYYLLCVA